MSDHGKYVLAQGSNAARRLEGIHKVWGPGMMRIAKEAGLQPGMRLADFGCGVGTALESFAEYLGPHGHLTGVDISSAQLDEARQRLTNAGAMDFHLVETPAESTPLKSDSYDFVYSRYLLIHLIDPILAVHEMLRVLKPGGILFIDDGDLSTVFSSPPSAGDEFSRIFMELGAKRGVDYSLGRRLHTLMAGAGVNDIHVHVEHPAYLRGDEKRIIAWSIEETKPAVVSTGLHTEDEIDAIIVEMHKATDDETMLFSVPRMNRVWGKK